MKNKKIAILGYGKEGKSTYNFLKKQNEKNITILDGNENADIPKDTKSILGKNYLNSLGEYDTIFKSPGISPYDENILPYGDKLTSQTETFFQNYKGKVICVTATKGKSTTSSLIYQVIKDAGYNVKLVGNIGKPVLDEIDLDKEYDYIVYEMSSYMLEGLKKTNYISVLGNIYPDHLGRHNGFENYKKAKLNILNGSEFNIVNIKLEIGNLKSADNLIYFGENTDYYFQDGFFYVKGERVFNNKEFKLLGAHNMENIVSVLAIADKIGINLDTVYETIRNFTGLPHRMEYIGTFQGIDFWDDAISTTPESTIYAIQTFGDNIGTIFLGGEDRGYDFSVLAKEILKHHIDNIVLFPNSGKNILKELGKYNKFMGTNKILYTESMKKAVDFAFENTEKGKICLLSCASPSYSLWKNFEEKGDEFQKFIKER